MGIHPFPYCLVGIPSFTGYLQAKATLEQRLIYGMYPEVITSPNKEKCVNTPNKPINPITKNPIKGEEFAGLAVAMAFSTY